MTDTSSNSNRHDADTIVIGAGASGCNAAWHLADRGQKVLLLESAAGPATQASQAAAGFVSAWSRVHMPTWDKVEWEMHTYAVKFYSELAEACGHDIGFFPCGVTFIYLTEKAWQEVQPRIESARELGTQLEVLSASRAAEIIPQINFETTTGIIYNPDAIRIRAAEAIPALADDIQRKGVTLKYNTPVTELLRDGDRVCGVVCGDQTFRADNVVIAAGAWSRPLVEQLGVSCRAEPKTETRYTTQPLPGLTTKMPLMIWADCHWFYMREEHGGLLIGGFEDDPLPDDRIVDPANPPRTEDMVSQQPYRIREFIREVENVFPALKDAEVGQTLGGVPCFTDDDLFIAGAVPRASGLFIIAGCNEGGVSHGPGLGKMTAELIVDGHSPWDRDVYHIDRFQNAVS